MSHTPTTSSSIPSGGVKGLVGGAIFLVAVLLAIVLGRQEYLEWHEKERIEEAQRLADRQAAALAAVEQAQAAGTRQGEVLEWRDECWTPCSMEVHWPYRLRGSGYDLEVRPTGLSSFQYPGQGGDLFRLPVVRRGTSLHFESLHPEIKKVLVQLYERKR